MREGVYCCFTRTTLFTTMFTINICDRVRGNRAYVGEIDFEIQAKTVGTISFVKVAFICLKFRVGIVESCQEV